MSHPAQRTVPAAPGPLGARLRDPFDGFFDGGAFDRPDTGLLDHPAAREWFALLRWGHEADLYTYQQPLGARAGVRVEVNGKSLLMLSSYDYLGLIGHPRVSAAAVAAVREYGTGTGGVRLLTGTTELHLGLERELAAFKGTEAALTLGSGYAANLAVIPALVGPRDRVIVDDKAHKSLVDACRLARVPVRRFAHNDVQSAEAALRAEPCRGHTLVVVEGLYSMDGDVCPLPELVALKREHGAYLLVDEAHSFGVLGATGRGVHEHFGLAPDDVDVWTGSLSKAVPANGGFVAGSRGLVIYLQHAGAPFVFSSALCPAATAAALAAVRVLREEPERVARLAENARVLRDGLEALGYDTGASRSAIVPVLLGEDETAYRAARRLHDLGLFVSAVVQPAVAAGAARLRLCATAAHTATDLEEAISAFRTLRVLSS